MVSRYGPVKQEGICILSPPPPPQHYRMIAPQRSDTFHVPSTAQTYGPQQPPVQQGGQGPLRTIAPTGPPNQPSTPPNSDIKVQQMPQPTSMNIAYVTSQTPIRGAQTFYRAQVPTSQTQRMTNHRQPQQPLFPTQPPYMTVPVQQTTAMFVPYPFSGPRPQNYMASTTFQMPMAQYSYTPSQTQGPPPYSFYSAMGMQRPGPAPPVVPGPQNSAQAPPANIQLAQSVPQPPVQRTKQRRTHAVPIIDPVTGVDKLEEMYEDKSHPPSGDSSARQTPQPPHVAQNKEVAATFAKQVAQAISGEENLIESDHLHHHAHHVPMEVMDHAAVYLHPSSNQAVNSRYDIVQSSKLQVQTKEFIPSNQNLDKETPVVSALTDAVEVTIPKQPPKDRESPAKNRKSREQTPRDQQQHAKEAPKTEVVAPSKEVTPVVEKPKEEKHKETSPSPAVPANKEAKEASNLSQREDRKKKVEKPQETGEAVPQPVQDNAANTGKNKSNSSQRNKDTAQKQTAQQNAQPAPKQVAAATPTPVVPVPQPAKPTSKSSKIKDLNLKGATKEGTDMDAFNDNNAPSADAVNANVPVVINDNFNVNPTPVIADNKKTEEAVVPVTKTETAKKAMVDVTAIVKDVPKPVKAFTAAAAAQPVKSQDETDRAVAATLSNNDKLVQAKNEANAKSNAETGDGADIIDNRPTYPYKEGQWSPYNPDGKKVYDKEFLLALRADPKSKRKPDNIQGDVYRAIYRSGGMGGRPDFAPSFGNAYMGKSSSQHGVPKRPSLQKSVGGGSKSNNKGVRVSISVREDVKLREAENAWRPARLNSGGNQTDEEKKTEELYKKVRGVLNKLTPQKFKTLVEQIRTLKIDTTERLQGVIDLVFEKAVDEPNFSYGYALLCRELALMQVPATNANQAANSKEKDAQEFVNFRKLLITRCQMEFEKNSVDESQRNLKVKEIEECTDPEKKKDLQLELEEYDRRIRMKSVGNIRFIGELFKQKMLTSKIILRCLSNLLNNRDEEQLECLCKLLTTVGKELEINLKNDLSSYFDTMKEIVDKKRGKISSRVRFMLQDVIDLRKNAWVPRRQDQNPKTMDQIQKEAENEQMNIQAMNSVPVTPRRDDRGSSTNSDRKKRTMDGEGWSTAPSRTRTSQQFSVQSEKLRSRRPQMDDRLGSSQMFGMLWCKGAGMTAPSANSPNFYAALENMPLNNDKQPSMGSRSSSKEVYNSVGHGSMEKNHNKQYNDDGRGSRSGSQHRINEPSQQLPAATPAKVQPVSEPEVTETVLPKDLGRRLENILEEYIADLSNIKDSSEEIKTMIPPSIYPQLVSVGYLIILERSKTARLKAGLFFASLIKMGTLPLNDYISGLEEVLAQLDDLIIDIPKVWDYLAEMLVASLGEEVLSLQALHRLCKPLLDQGYGPKLLAPLLRVLKEEKNAKFVHGMWQASGLKLTDFMSADDVDGFIKQNVLEFLLEGGDAISGDSVIDYNQVHNKLLQLFETKASFDEVVDWVNRNVGEKIKENKFIRTLATAIFENSIVQNRLQTDVLKGHYKLLQRFVDNNPTYELQCLYALQALISRLEHPQGLLLSICSRLHEDGVFPQESFIAWEVSKDPAEQEGKGVAVMQLTSFFTDLRENEEEDFGSTTSDEA